MVSPSKIADSVWLQIASRAAILFAAVVGLPLCFWLMKSTFGEVQELARDAGTIKYRLEKVDNAIKDVYTKEDAGKDARAQEIRDDAQDEKIRLNETRILTLEGRRRFFPSPDSP